MNIAVYCGSSEGGSPSYKKSAIELGTWIGENGHTLVFGGSNTGLMSAVANATLKAGGEVIGVVPDVELIRKVAHPGLTEYYYTKDMAERRSKMIELADAFVALPGGPGTLDELSEVITLQRLGLNDKPVVLFDTEGFYQSLRAVFREMIAAKFAAREDFSRVMFSADMKKIGAFLEGDYSVK